MTASPRNELEPKRLLDDEAAPLALRDALHALRERAPSDASAARLRERIQSPPAAARGWPSAGACVALLGLIGAVAFSLWPESTPAPAARPIEAAPPGTDRQAPAESVEHGAGPAPQRAVAKPTATAGAPQTAAAHERDPEPKAAPAASAPAPAIAPEAAAEPRRSERRPKLAPRPPASAEPEPQAAVAPEPALPALPAEPAPKPAAIDDAERMFADPQDEAGLLYRAKRLSSSEPNAALRLLVLHEASFPTGAFAEERDMLEIQIHERLGHTATVKRLGAIFKQRYPGSVYQVSP